VIVSATKEEAFMQAPRGAPQSVAPSSAFPPLAPISRSRATLNCGAAPADASMSAAVRLAWSSAYAGSSIRIRSSIILSTIQRQPRKAGDVTPLQGFGPRNFRRRIDTARGDFLEPSPRARHRLEQRRIGFPWYVLGAGDSEDLRACFVGPARERNPEVHPNTARGKLRLFNYLDQGCRPFSLRGQEPTRLRRKFEHFPGRPGFQFRTPARRQAPPVCPRGRL
jgi:hypothetical protein